jgi:Flp pilus assembly protein TadD
MLGHLQVAAGEWATGIETLEGIRRRIGNRDAAVLTDLSLGYAGDGDAEVALRYAKAAYALAPMNPAATDAYGVALAASGDVPGARQLLVKATKLAPGDTAIASHLKQLG